MFSELQLKISAILSASDATIENRLQAVCELLKTTVPHYDWVGFYFKNLAPMPEHLRIIP